jgi:hypothetical protein
MALRVRIHERRLFERLNPKQFEQCFEQWVQQLVYELGIQVIAIDGKNLRGSYDRESGVKALPDRQCLGY